MNGKIKNNTMPVLTLTGENMIELQKETSAFNNFEAFLLKEKGKA